MQKRGRTAAGTQRWFCARCRVSGVRSRPDTRTRHVYRHFVAWITGTRELESIAHDLSFCRDRLTDLFRPLWSLPAPQPPAAGDARVLVVDGVYLSGHGNAVLIGHADGQVRTWRFAEHECRSAWAAFFAAFASVEVVVMDGQKGLGDAVAASCPGARVQRCLVHVERFVRSCLSQRPKTEAGRELWRLVRVLWDVRTPADAERWLAAFAAWQNRHDAFCKERSWPDRNGRRPFTHRKLRAARTHIRNALPYLFTFTEVPGVPRTTNAVEGGVNARLKELVRRHRGLSPERKRVLAAYFLASRARRKPPRNAT